MLIDMNKPSIILIKKSFYRKLFLNMQSINVLFKLNLLIQFNNDKNIKNNMFAITGVSAQSRGFSILIAHLDKLPYKYIITRGFECLLL